MHNKIQLIGRIGKDPETRKTQNSSVCNFSVATTSREKDKEGNWLDHTEWFNVVFFGKTAENAGNLLKKGKLVFVEGRLKTEKFNDKEGMERQIVKLYGAEFKLLSPKDETVSNDKFVSNYKGQGDKDFDDEEIPF